MKVINIPAEEKLLAELLEQAREEALILQTTDGRWFVLSAIGRWEGFDVGSDEDFEQEVARTSENHQLLKLLRERRRGGPSISLADVERELGLD